MNDKIKTKVLPPKVPSTPYPQHFRSTRCDLEVLAFTSSYGVVTKGNSSYPTGYFDSEWSPFTNRNEWCPIERETTFSTPL